MSCERKRIAGVLLVVWIVMGCQVAQCGPSATQGMAPVHELGNGAHVLQWLVIGPFPNPAEGPTRAGYDRDYLTELGGEAQAVLAPETVVTYVDEEGMPRKAATGLIEAGIDAVVNVDKHFNGVDYKVAYAFAYIHCDRDRKAHCFLGSDDWAKVWINGEQVLANWSGSGRCPMTSRLGIWSSTAASSPTRRCICRVAARASRAWRCNGHSKATWD